MGTTWQRGIQIPIETELKKVIPTDVVIIGGGATGISLAYYLSKANKKVVVIDKNTLIDSATAKTTAFLCENVDTTLPSLVSLFGRERAEEVWRSHREAINKIEEIVKNENIECEFTRTKEYVYALTKTHRDRLDKEYRTSRSLGFPVEKFEKGSLPFVNEGGYIIPSQAKFHPLKYFKALRELAKKQGAEFYEETEAIQIEAGLNPIVKTPRGAITAKYVVIATHLSIVNPPTIFARKGAYLSYIMELGIPRGSLPEGIYEDTHDPYHYFRVDKGDQEDRMLIGGEDHRKELPINPEKNFRALEDYLRKNFPTLKYNIREKWRGPIVETLDGLPYIGVPDRSRPSLLVATGYSGNGMTYSNIAATIIANDILEKENKYAFLYDPYRLLNPLCIPIKARDYGGTLLGGYLKNLFK